MPKFRPTDPVQHQRLHLQIVFGAKSDQIALHLPSFASIPIQERAN
jgi:hypothetical protein